MKLPRDRAHLVFRSAIHPHGVLPVVRPVRTGAAPVKLAKDHVHLVFGWQNQEPGLQPALRLDATGRRP